MRIENILKSTLPNELKDKLPKGKAYKLVKSAYGIDHEEDEDTDAGSSDAGATAGGADGGAGE